MCSSFSKYISDFCVLDPNAEYYDYYYSRATYHNTKHYNEWNEKALDAIRLNMKDQHTEMKRQLQERHKDIANHVGQDVSDEHSNFQRCIVKRTQIHSHLNLDCRLSKCLGSSYCRFPE